MLTDEHDTHQLRHGYQQRVREPLSELVEWNDTFPARSRRHRGTRPGIAERYTIELSAGLRPYWGQPVHEHGPQCWDGYHGGDPKLLGCRVLKQVIWEA